jgi:hypothetical protein
METKSIQVYVTPQEHKEIKKFCVENDISMTWLFVKLMLEYIYKEK